MKEGISHIGIFSAVLLLIISCSNEQANQQSYNRGINIIPNPVSITVNKGMFTLKKNTPVYISDAEAKSVGDFFVTRLNGATGYQVSISEKKQTGGISLVIDHTLDVNDEGYYLDVTPGNATVKAGTPQGLFYGMQSFLQLLPAEIESAGTVKNTAWTVPAVSIRDEPRFGYRGLMLDVCRHFETVENIKKHLDVLALFKINRFHWHLTDDQGWRIEIKKYPGLTGTGAKRIEGEGYEYSGHYTQEEIREVVDYAAERFITVIPEIEIPGHAMAAIAAYPELSCTGEQYVPRIVWGVEDIVLCAGKESTFEFLENVFAEVVQLFPSEYVHIGGDECPKRNWKECPLCRKRIREEGIKAHDGHSAEEVLQSYFVQQVEKILAGYGKKIIGWDEILEGGLAPTATVMSWRGEAGAVAAANMDHEAIMTPNSGGMYIDQYQGDYKIEPVAIGGYNTAERIYNYDPLPGALVEAGKSEFVKGVQCNMWAEYLYSSDVREYRIYPRILSLAEIGWTPLDRKDYNDFIRRLDNALVRLDGHRINYHIPQPEQPFGSCNFVAFTDKAVLKFKTTRPVKMVYTLDGSEPDAGSTVYSQPVEITGTGILKIRSVLPSGKMSSTRSIVVEKQEFAPAKTVADTRQGLKMTVTDGDFLDVTQITNNAVWKDKAISSLREITRQKPFDESLGSLRDFEQYAAVATGYVNIPDDDVYYFSSDFEEVWIDGKLLINNMGEVKRFSRNDKSVALAKGLHELKAVFLGHIIGGWPSVWNRGDISIRKAGAEKFEPVTPDMLVY